jgi:tRNA dimethylallyltransferase
MKGCNIIVIAGPTGVGKSDVAIRLCKRLNGEIISADSVQVYRGLDIGSNKASAQEQKDTRHHLLDVYAPDEDCAAGQFYDKAMDAIADINNRGKVAVVVGGTMMYIKWLINGKPNAPKPSKSTTDEVQALLQPHKDAEQWDAALALLVELDPVRASGSV